MNFEQQLSVWIDTDKRVISFRELLGTQQVWINIEKILELVSQGYKIG